jgi:hypothetical protein
MATTPDPSTCSNPRNSPMTKLLLGSAIVIYGSIFLLFIR